MCCRGQQILAYCLISRFTRRGKRVRNANVENITVAVHKLHRVVRSRSYNTLLMYVVGKIYYRTI